MGGAHLIVRTCWVFSSTGINFLNTILRLAKERAELRVVSDQFGAPTSARSIASGIVSTIRGQPDTTAELRTAEIAQRFSLAKGLLHLSNTGETSWHGFACAIVEGLRARDPLDGPRHRANREKGLSDQGSTAAQFQARSEPAQSGIRNSNAHLGGGPCRRTE